MSLTGLFIYLRQESTEELQSNPESVSLLSDESDESESKESDEEDSASSIVQRCSMISPGAF